MIELIHDTTLNMNIGNAYKVPCIVTWKLKEIMNYAPHSEACAAMVYDVRCFVAGSAVEWKRPAPHHWKQILEACES